MSIARRVNAPPPFIVGTPVEKSFGSVTAYSADLTMGYQPGDLLIAWVATDGDARAPASVPNWTRQAPVAPGANGEFWAIWKWADGTEGTSVTWTEGSAIAGATLAVAIRRAYRAAQQSPMISSGSGVANPATLNLNWQRPQDVALVLGVGAMRPATTLSAGAWINPNWQWITADKRIGLEWAWLRGPSVDPPAFTQTGSASETGRHTWAIRGNP